MTTFVLGPYTYTRRDYPPRGGREMRHDWVRTHSDGHKAIVGQEAWLLIEEVMRLQQQVEALEYDVLEARDDRGD